MNITLQKEEALDIIHAALCNGGLTYLSGASLNLIGEDDYDQARQRLKDKAPEDEVICFEDVLAEILRNGEPLRFYDEEGLEEVSFTLEQAIKRLSNEDCSDILLQYKQEIDDACTAYDLLQYCLYGEIIYG